MAVFLMNICKFNGCGITFRTLGDLIQHIEDTHIDFDPRVLEKQELQQPPCIPLSYVLRFFTDTTKKENLEYLKKQKRAQSPAVSVCSTTPSGSEFDEEELVSESEDSNDSWTTQEEFSSEFILRYGSRIGGNTNPNEEKPFACPVPGCKKRYKNINGIKYHAKNGHRKDARVKKAFRCHCGKSYKTSKGLRMHTNSHHSGGMPAAIAESIVGASDSLHLGSRIMTSSHYVSSALPTNFPPPNVTVQPEVSIQIPNCGHSPLSLATATSNIGLPNSSLVNTPPPTPTSSPTTHTTSAPTYSYSSPFNSRSIPTTSNGTPLTSTSMQHTRILSTPPSAPSGIYQSLNSMSPNTPPVLMPSTANQ